MKPTLFQSFMFAVSGLISLFRKERNFKIEIFALFINIFLLLFLQVEKYDALIILALSVSILILEILNTVIEKICDLLQPAFDLRIKFIKDISAAMVLLMSVFAIVAALFIYPKYV